MSIDLNMQMHIIIGNYSLTKIAITAWTKQTCKAKSNKRYLKQNPTLIIVKENKWDDSVFNILENQNKCVDKKIFLLYANNILSILEYNNVYREKESRFSSLIMDILYNVHGAMRCQILRLENSLDSGGTRCSTHTINRQETLMDPIYIIDCLYLYFVNIASKNQRRRDIHINDVGPRRRGKMFIHKQRQSLEWLKKIPIFMNSWRDK